MDFWFLDQSNDRHGARTLRNCPIWTCYSFLELALRSGLRTEVGFRLGPSCVGGKKEKVIFLYVLMYVVPCRLGQKWTKLYIWWHSLNQNSGINKMSHDSERKFSLSIIRLGPGASNFPSRVVKPKSTYPKTLGSTGKLKDWQVPTSLGVWREASIVPGFFGYQFLGGFLVSWPISGPQRYGSNAGWSALERQARR